MKHKIEKNTVQETLIIPLFARKVCSELYPNLYRDETSIRLIDEIDYDFSEAEKNSCSLSCKRILDLRFIIREQKCLCHFSEKKLKTMTSMSSILWQRILSAHS